MKTVTLLLAAIFLLAQASAFEFCDDGTVGENDIRLISIDDMLKENTKEWTWESLQQIEIETRVENRNDEDATYIIEAIFKDGENTIRIAQDSDDLEKEFDLSANERKSISLEFEVEEDLEKNTYDVYIKFYKKSDEDKECVENSEEELKIEKVEICEGDRVDDDELEITDISDRTEDNENEWEWAPGDNIEISLDLKNKDYSKRDFTIDLVFLDENNEEVFLADNSDDTTEETNLDEDESDDIKFNFKLKSDINEEKYSLYARAYDSDDDDICTSLKAEDKSSPKLIEIKKAERKVIVTNVEGPNDLTTSTQAQYTATLTNLGSEDEESVLAVIYNRQLNIIEKLEIENLDSGEEVTVNFNVIIPDNASLSRHAILFSTEYEYRESQDYYKSSSDEDDDIKHYITITQGEEPEINETPEINENETIVEESSETIVEIPTENETKIPTTIMTGNVIGTPTKSPSWIILLGLIVLAIIGIILFFKKPKAKKGRKIEAPQVIRRYSAKLK